jgi:tRNA A37 methylthiotransferase MiaB
MEGCSKFCTFCIVPYTRGGEVSRPFDDVLTEVAGLASQGRQGSDLLGQNVNAFRGDMADSEEKADLAILIEYIAEIPGIERIRYTTSHPREMSQRLIDTYATVPKLVSHLHLPVQSGADRVLAAMKRGYTAIEYKSIIRKLRAARPDISLSSDFIVGFPGETDEDFRKDHEADRRRRFRRSFSFIYSPRPGTPAEEMEDSTPDVKSARLSRLQKRIEEQAQVISQSMVGSGAARADRRHLEKGCSRTGRTHRQQPRRQFRRQSAADQYLCRCADHRRIAAQPEGRNCHPRSLRLHPRAGRWKFRLRRSTTFYWPICAARLTRISGRSKPVLMSPFSAATSAFRCAVKSAVNCRCHSPFLCVGAGAALGR